MCSLSYDFLFLDNTYSQTFFEIRFVHIIIRFPGLSLDGATPPKVNEDIFIFRFTLYFRSLLTGSMSNKYISLGLITNLYCFKKILLPINFLVNLIIWGNF